MADQKPVATLKRTTTLRSTAQRTTSTPQQPATQRSTSRKMISRRVTPRPTISGQAAAKQTTSRQTARKSLTSIQYLNEEEVIAINLYVIQQFALDAQSGVKAPELLNWALHRGAEFIAGKDIYHTVFSKAAALFEALTQRPAFYCANQQTAFLCLLQFLKYNGMDFSMDANQAENFVESVANHRYAFEKIVEIIKAFSQEQES